MRPEQGGGGEDVGRPVDHRPATDDSQLRQQRQQPEQRRELVHPHLLRVPDQHRRDGREGGREQPGPPVVQLPSQLVEHRDHERPGDQRGEPDGELAVTERADRQPQHEVVERRLTIPLVQVLEQVVQRESRLMDGDRLVEPDPTWDGESQRQPREDQAPEDEQRGVMADVRFAPSRQAAARAEQLSFVRTAEPLKQRSCWLPLRRLDRLQAQCLLHATESPATLTEVRRCEWEFRMLTGRCRAGSVRARAQARPARAGARR